MRVLMCKPEFFNISYEINPWMDINVGADESLAMQQWQQLYQTILDCGAKVELVPPVSGLPDLVFTANAALIHKNKVYMARFKHPERQGEHAYYTEWFQKDGQYEIVKEPSEFFDAAGDYCGPTFEGAGDGLFLGDTLFTAYGFRSDEGIYNKLCEQMDVKQHVNCELVTPYFYHLDTCFCPLNDKQAIWFPGAFSEASQQRMQEQGELFAVPEEEAKHFACNAVVLGESVIIPAECPKTAKILQDLGFTVYDCPMTEFLKSGGACKCLTLRLP